MFYNPNYIVIPQRKIPVRDWSKLRQVTFTNRLRTIH